MQVLSKDLFIRLPASIRTHLCTAYESPFLIARDMVPFSLFVVHHLHTLLIVLPSCGIRRRYSFGPVEKVAGGSVRPPKPSCSTQNNEGKKENGSINLSI